MRIPWRLLLLMMMYCTCHWQLTTKLVHQHVYSCANPMPRTNMIDYNEAICYLITVIIKWLVWISIWKKYIYRKHWFFSFRFFHWSDWFNIFFFRIYRKIYSLDIDRNERETNLFWSSLKRIRTAASFRILYYPY